MTVAELRKKYPVFEYMSFDYKIVGEDLACSWHMASGDLNFNPELVVHGGASGATKLATSELDNLVFHVGLADIFSYWKPTCSPQIKISAGKLGSDQLVFWHNLLIKGMGQYFYTNNIDYKAPDFVTFTSEGPSLDLVMSDPKPGILIPVGGGKDSAVTLELLKDQTRVGAFSMNVSWSKEMLPASKRLMDTAGITDQIFVERILDPKLKELKSAGFLDGHIPFSAYMDFLSVLLAKIFDYDKVTFSNERSSNEANLDYLGDHVNHQYSKSFEFEQDFDKYNQAYLSKVNIFSFLRPLYELQIMQIFSQPPMDKYFTQFKSCNVGYKTDSWCGSCPKCLSVFVGLFPFVKTEKLVSIFGKNLFEDPNLLQLTKDVLGLGSGKPFECIGTYEETVVAFYLSFKKVEGQTLPTLLAYFSDQQSILEHRLGNLADLSHKILTAWNTANNLPTNLSEVLKQNLAL